MEKIHLRIGSSPDNDLVVKGTTIEAKHAEFFCDSEGNAFLTDLNSSYGTFINGQELRGFKMLRKGDKVVLGKDYIFRWENHTTKMTISYETEDEEESTGEAVRQKQAPPQSPKSPKEPSNKRQPIILPDPKINRQLVMIYAIVVLLSLLMYTLF